jgi:hypothetical protein
MTAGLVPVSASTTIVASSADAFVLSSSPDANRGRAVSLRIRGLTKVSYIRFDVPGLQAGEAISVARLRLFATSGSKCAAGVQVLRAGNDSWGERTITWNNQPGTVGSPLAEGTWSSSGYQEFNVTSAVLGTGPVSFVVMHGPGCESAREVSFNSREATSGQPELTVETSVAPPPQPQCSDGLDNDGDGLTDHPADPGCTDASDTDETDPTPPPPPQCSDGLDNDGDGLTDHPADPGCTDASDTDETDPTPPPPPGSTKIVAAAGDIVCDPSAFAFPGTDPTKCQHRATAALLAAADAVLPLGDAQYSDGTLEKFNAGYDPSWGVYAPTTYPAVGNHEYNDPAGDAFGYYEYWRLKGRPTGGAGSGYYSSDLGSWHLIALNSNCTIVPCAEGTVQNDFLEQDLASTPQPCILAYWHHPLFNSGAVHGGAVPSGARAFWNDLYAAGADIVLNGHEHNYQRYGKQDPAGLATSNGIREFVVGTGGRGFYAMLDAKDPNFEFGNATDFGVLRLYLADGSYSWEFVGVDGAALDSGGPVPCN